MGSPDKTLLFMRIRTNNVSAFFDESGTDGASRFLVISGWIGGLNTWVDFGARWREVVQRYEASEFHARDFFSRKPSGARKGEYSEWDKAKGERFLVELLALASETKRLTQLGAVVDTRAFFEFSEEDRKRLTLGVRIGGKWETTGAPNSPYFCPFQLLIMQAIRRTKAGRQVNVFYDHNDATKHQAEQCFAVLKQHHYFEERLGCFTFGNSKGWPGIQLADMSAYLWGRVANKRNLRSEERNVLRFLEESFPGGSELPLINRATLEGVRNAKLIDEAEDL